jgi:NADH-quinone oxidoreductase subunit J
MISDVVIFVILAAVAIGAAVGMLLSRNAIYSVLNLIMNFGAVALFYLILKAPFIALVQITVYAGAIMVLFLFVIMLLGAERLRTGSTLPWQQPAAVVLGILLLATTFYVLFFKLPQTPVYLPVSEDFGSAFAVGLTLFNQYLLPFEVTSVLLLVAMIGAITLSKRHRKTKQS